MNGSGVDYPRRLNIASRLVDGALEAGRADRAAFRYRGKEIS